MLSVMGTDVRLRDVVEADLEVFFEQEHDEEATRRSKFKPRERDRFMAHWKANVLGDPDTFVQAILADGALAGNAVAWTEEDGRRFVGYWLGREFWGRGIGTLALRQFLAAEKARPLYADPVVENVGSVKLLEKVGFTRSGIVRHGENEHVLLVLRS
jgi:RimJ/RimL family protein N-acetyltransferase